MENKIDNRPAPRFAVGDWAYNNHAGHNARIVHVSWDKLRGGWRYAVPGLSDPDMYAEEKDKPYVEYEQVGHAWRRVSHG